MKKPRIIIMTDISTLDAEHGEPDDTQSLIRFMLYSNQFDIAGFIATYTSHSNNVFPEYLREIISIYGEIQKNLVRIDNGFPDTKELLSRIYSGSVLPGFDRTENDFDTEGSERIINAADESPEPLWILAWGGVTDLARAIRKAEQIKNTEEFKIWLSKLRIYAISDQYDNCGPWIKHMFPSLFYITNYQAFRGMYRGGDETLCDSAWVKKNISHKGILGKAYPVYNGGDIYSNILGKVQGVKEGDTPSFLYLLNNGPGDPEIPEYGGWGGRFIRMENTNHYFDTSDFGCNECNEFITINRFRHMFQRDFSSRMSWCLPECKVQSYPDISISCNKNEIYSNGSALLTSKTDFSGELKYNWSYYPEAGEYRGAIFFRNRDEKQCEILIAKNPQTKGKIHIILDVTTTGENPSCVSKRLILNVA